MPRKLSNAEVFDRLSLAGIIRDVDPAVTTTTIAAITAGVTATIEVASAVGLAQGDIIRIGEGDKLEIVKIKTLAAAVITPTTDFALDHVSGAAVALVEKVQIGEVTEEGVKHNTALDRNPIKTATTRGVFVYLIRGIEQTISWATPNMSLENIALALGIPESAISGTGTADDPYTLILKEASVATAVNHSVYFKGVLHDGTTVEVQGWGVDFDGSGDRTFTSGDAAPVPFSFNVKNVAIYIPAFA